eukprot:TRINITY_DN30148_c0_g1_i1.p1 TRINITY_DN30148_c0_g1~~TRINITY_DN30148_c0_g1_i1.p1  ORF type:complete len:284 (-),score=36.39 TRINITY_DN30148_c0_g1_i1:58-837(-)
MVDATVTSAPATRQSAGIDSQHMDNAAKRKSSLDDDVRVQGMSLSWAFEWEGASSDDIVADLRKKRCCWTGDFWRDYILHVANWHPLLSVFCCHPAHPYSKARRLVVFSWVCAFSLLPAAALTRLMTVFGGWIGSMTAPIVVFFIVTWPVMVLQFAVEKLMEFEWVLHQKRDQFPQLLRNIGWVVEWSSMIGAFGFSMFVFAVSCFFIRDHIAEAVSPFAVSRAQSWLFWFPFDFLMPFFGFQSCWRKERNAQDSDGSR